MTSQPSYGITKETFRSILMKLIKTSIKHFIIKFGKKYSIPLIWPYTRNVNDNKILFHHPSLPLTRERRGKEIKFYYHLPFS
jgi:hypothetical protein